MNSMHSVVILTFAMAAFRVAGDPLAALQLRTELSWKEPFPGDPLRVRVQLASPAHQMQRVRQMQEALQGVTDLTPITIQPQIPADWHEALRVSLVRLLPDGTSRSVLTAEQWRAALRTQAPGVSVIEELAVSRSREWLVGPEVVGLTPGTYLLHVAWNGSGTGVAPFLPVDGILSAQEVRFEVKPPDTATDLASHLIRLAFHEFGQGRYATAREYGWRAIELEPGNAEADRVENRMRVASSAFRSGDLVAAARAYQELMTLLPGGSGEIREQVTRQLSALAPELRGKQGYPSEQPIRLELVAIPNQVYVIYSSTDLTTWSVLSTNRPVVNTTEVLGHPVSGVPRFYRAVWMGAE